MAGATAAGEFPAIDLRRIYIELLYLKGNNMNFGNVCNINLLFLVQEISFLATLIHI
jgi:hypothetical protein